MAGASTAMVTKRTNRKMPTTPSGWWRRVGAKAIDGHDRISARRSGGAEITREVHGSFDVGHRASYLGWAGCYEEENAMRERYWLSTTALAATMVVMAAAPASAQQSAEQQVMELA